jgi:FMN phosphatase YigB (HAD superfamily)
MSVNAAAVVLESAPVVFGPGVASPLDPQRQIRGVLFDLDGTLYDQRLMRLLMAAELLTLPFRRPLRARQDLRGLAAYRRAQETLRLIGSPAPMIDTQLERAAERVGLSAPELAPIVNEWMFVRPLKYMRLCRAGRLLELLTLLRGSGVALGVLSDYPAAAKLRALGVDEFFSPVLCTADTEIGFLKPHPRGFLRVAESWRLAPREVLVVGDRVDADAAGAAAAGMPCVIVGARGRGAAPAGDVLMVPTLERLYRVFVNNDRR